MAKENTTNNIYESAQKQFEWFCQILDEDDSIRWTYTQGSKNADTCLWPIRGYLEEEEGELINRLCFCPLTAVAYLNKGMKIALHNYDDAGRAIGLRNYPPVEEGLGLYTYIAYLSDNALEYGKRFRDSHPENWVRLRDACQPRHSFDPDESEREE